MLAPMKVARERLAESIAAFRDNFDNPQLRRIQLAGAGSVMGLWAYSVALAVFAYDAGGAKAVGIVTLVRAIPAAISAPFTSTLADRLPRVPFMVATNIGRAAAIGAAGAVALAGGSEWLVYTLAGLAAILGTAFLPAESALLPTLARSAEELTAANVVRSTIESVGTFAGPAVGGALLAVTTPGTVMLVTAAAFVWGAVLVAMIHPDTGRGEETAEESGRDGAFLRELTAGFGAIARDRRLRVVVGLYSAQTLLAGALGVLVVVTALDLLSWNDSGVGLLNAAMGVGGIVGSLAAFALIGRKRLASDFGLGIVLWGAPLAAIGIWPHAWVALVALAILGLGNTLVDVAGLTLLQRTAPPDVIGRVFGVLEMILVATIGLGAAVAPVLIHAFGVRWSLVATGAFLPVLAALTWRRLVQIDAESHAPAEFTLLESVPIFSPLPRPSLERLASQLQPVVVAAGITVIRQGDPGDRFYVVESGRLRVTVDGASTGELSPGGSFGEIALLRNVPRTATVVAKTDARLWALGRDDFLDAVTGHPPSARAADAVVGAQLARRAPQLSASAPA
jgi:predicted MFS family arabinose efflux permease